MIIPTLPGNASVCAISIEGWNAIATALNKCAGSNGVKLAIDADGGLRATLGDDTYSFRTITTCEPTNLADGTPALALRSVRVLCAMPQQDSLIVLPLSRVQLVKDEAGGLIGIVVNGETIDVEDCG